MILVGANSTILHGQSSDHSPQRTWGPNSMPRRTCQSDARKANTLTLPRDCRAIFNVSSISKRRNTFCPVLRTILQHPPYRLPSLHIRGRISAFHFASTCLLQLSLCIHLFAPAFTYWAHQTTGRFTTQQSRFPNAVSRSFTAPAIGLGFPSPSWHGTCHISLRVEADTSHRTRGRDVT
jgi:hypothetical protein